MNPESLWKILEFVDELHKYLMFLNVLGVYLIIKNFTSNRIARLLVTSISSFLVVLFIAEQNPLEIFSSQSVLIFIALLAPLLIYLVLSKISWLKKSLHYFEKIIIAISIFFFYTQAIFGGCIIYSMQNALAKNYLKLEYWRANGVFGTAILAGWDLPLRLVYFVFASSILFKMVGNKYPKKILLKIKKSIFKWHDKSVVKIFIISFLIHLFALV